MVITAVFPTREYKIPESTLPYRLDLFQDPVNFMGISSSHLRKNSFIFLFHIFQVVNESCFGKMS